jgi:hypothetical protein
METSVLSVLELMIEFTAYTLAKFVEMVRFVNRSKEKLLRLNKLGKTLMIAGIIEILASALTSIYFAYPQPMLSWLTMVGVSPIVFAQQVCLRIKAPLLPIKGDGEYENLFKNYLV